MNEKETPGNTQNDNLDDCVDKYKITYSEVQPKKAVSNAGLNQL